MALFEYSCEKCGATFEKIVRPSRKTARIVCPSCGGAKVKRHLSRVSATRMGGANGDAAACGSSGFG